MREATKKERESVNEYIENISLSTGVCFYIDKNKKNNITKEIWKEIEDVLNKHNISYTSHYESRDIETAMEYPDRVVQDKYIQISLIIPDYFDDYK